MSVKKKLFIKTYGCQMNVYDSERMAEVLAGDYAPADSAEDANLVLLNTCHIREKAGEKVFSELGRIRQIAEAKRKAGGEMRVGVTGCVAQAEGEEIVRRQPLVDLVVGPQAYHRLPDMLAEQAKGGGVQIATDFPADDKFARPRNAKARRAPAAFLTVQEGCDKFCTFCVVPYTRGAEISRPAEQVLAEARDLVDRGVVEITLLGQNVNAYSGAGRDGPVSLARLIRALAGIEGLRRIRYTTSHPNDMDADLVAAHAEVDALMPYLHLPAQAGADRVLAAMNRRHTGEEYIRLVERIRAARPDLALSGDFIVGFPGETDAEFVDTMALVEEVGYAQAYSFKYSARPGTPAADLAPVDPQLASERLQRLQALLRRQQDAFQASMVGRTLPVLVEKPGRAAGQMAGRSPYLHPVHFDAAPDLVGRIVDVEITAATPNALAGRLKRAETAPV